MTELMDNYTTYKRKPRSRSSTLGNKYPTIYNRLDNTILPYPRVTTMVYLKMTAIHMQSLSFLSQYTYTNL